MILSNHWKVAGRDVVGVGGDVDVKTDDCVARGGGVAVLVPAAGMDMDFEVAGDAAFFFS